MFPLQFLVFLSVYLDLRPYFSDLPTFLFNLLLSPPDLLFQFIHYFFSVKQFFKISLHCLLAQLQLLVEFFLMFVFELKLISIIQALSVGRLDLLKLLIMGLRFLEDLMR
jgi:hypothetical protein